MSLVKLFFPTLVRVWSLFNSPKDSDVIATTKFILKAGSVQAAKTQIARLLQEEAWWFVVDHCGSNEMLAMHLVESIGDAVDCGVFRQTKAQDLPQVPAANSSPLRDPAEEAETFARKAAELRNKLRSEVEEAAAAAATKRNGFHL